VLACTRAPTAAGQLLVVALGGVIGQRLGAARRRRELVSAIDLVLACAELYLLDHRTAAAGSSQMSLQINLPYATFGFG
jgi:hypothetical protein